MKKIFIVIVLFLFLTLGCTLNDTKTPSISKEETEKKEYIKYVKKLKSVSDSSNDIPFDINIEYDKLTDEEIQYQVVIDNPKDKITDIKAIAIHDKQTDDVFPSIGIFDDSVNLILGEKPEGIVLVGYIPFEDKLEKFDCEFKVLVSYKINDNEYTSYFVTKK